MIDVGVRISAAVGIVWVACAGAPALADLPNPLADGLRHCAGESDQAKRLACFDALAAGLPKVEADQFGLTADIARKRQPRTKRQAAPTGAGGAAAGDAAAGSTAGGAAVEGSTAVASGATKPTEPKQAEQFLPGRITALRQAAGGVLVFTLDNRQVWAQANADTRFSFEVGDEVRIEHGAMGSFWLAANKGRKTKVKRIS